MKDSWVSIIWRWMSLQSSDRRMNEEAAISSRTAFVSLKFCYILHLIFHILARMFNKSILSGNFQHKLITSEMGKRKTTTDNGKDAVHHLHIKSS